MTRPWETPPWRSVAVYGLGISGQAAVCLLLDRGDSATAVTAVDDRPREALDLSPLGEAADDPRLRLLCGPDLETAGLPEGLDGMVLSPGVPPDRPWIVAAREAGVSRISEVELAFPLLDGPVVAITGTNGKSTTTELAGAMLRAADRPVEVCGNIGEPVSRRVDGPAGRVFVIEMSSYQLEAVDTFRPRAAAFLNLTPDHLDRYPSFEAYGQAKAALFRRQEAGDTAIFNADDPAVVRLAAAENMGEGRRRWFSRLRTVEDGCYLDGDRVVEVAPEAEPLALFDRGAVPLAGAHNLENAMAAALLARALGAEPEALRTALASFRGLPHRMQKVGEVSGVTFYDDSKGTNLAATAKSLEDLPDGTVHLILGGRAKGDDPAELLDLVRLKARHLYLIGEAAETFRAAYQGMVPLTVTGTLDRAVDAAAQRSRAGEIVLLSPACASFDQFSNYRRRGERFQQLVAELAAKFAAAPEGRGHGQEARL
jgi:UDP-N-acetylmuramoylalanine--D-glutamate ligase